MIINALKITADKMALSGVSKCMNSSLQRWINRGKCGRIITKYLETSLEILKVVKAPRVINNCFPIFHDFDPVSWITIEVDHVSGLASRLGAGMHGNGDISLSQGGASFVPSPVIATNFPPA